MIRLIKIILIAYACIGIAAYYLQDKVLFHPEPLPSDYTFQFDISFTEMNIPVNQEDTVSLISFHPPGRSKGTLIYYHGNMKNIEYYFPQIKDLVARGYEVWVPDYPGYGKSRGGRTEKKMLDQAMLVYKKAASVTSPDSIIIYGKSLGTGIAAYVASNASPRLLILETPYYSIPELFRFYLPVYPVKQMSNYQIPTYLFLQSVSSRVIMFHGTEDEVIPFKNAVKLEKFMKPGDLFIPIKGGRHNNLPSSSQYQEILQRELQLH